MRPTTSYRLMHESVFREMKELPVLYPWARELQAGVQRSSALAVGVFAENGHLEYANAGMAYLLGAGREHDPAAYLINPGFSAFLERPEGEGPVFDGVLTTGNGLDFTLTTNARVYRRGGQLLFLCEFDVLELDRLNKEMVLLNQEVHNLQRDLIRKKRDLERTLKELRETQAMLIHSEKMNSLGSLVAGVAHEINNPVSFVTGNIHNVREAFGDLSAAYMRLESLLSERAGEDAGELLEGVRDEFDVDFLLEDFDDLCNGMADGTSRVEKIVKDLRTFSRHDQAALKLMDLREGIESALTIAGSAIKEKDIRTDLDPGQLPQVECYAAELDQVFLNLILNAVQAMERGGVLTISGAEDHENVLLTFADTGCGIPPEIRDRIFDPFFTTKPVGSGTGLGLSLAYKIIAEMHGGTIAVDSKPGIGSTFTITIPKDIKR